MNTFKTDSLFASQEPDQTICNHIVRIAFESGVDKEFDYLAPDALWPIEVGQRVEAPFGRGNKAQIGFCVQIAALDNAKNLSHREIQSKNGKRIKLKKIARVIDKEPLIDTGLMELARWISSYYVCPLGQVLTAVVPAAVKKGAGVQKQKYIYLANGYEELIEQVKGKKQKEIIGVLTKRKAFDSKAAVELETLLENVGCTNGPVKKLAEKLVIKTAQKTILKSLPAIPEALVLKTEKVTLNEDQRKALEYIKQQIDSGKFGVTLLHGVTDSGKTEVYIRAIEGVIKKGRAAIVLLPEIALTAQTVQRFSSRFEKIAVMHSGLTGGQRNVGWQKIKSGEVDVVIGARSAIFGPVPNLGLVIVDEEHEPSYKQDTQPRYHGRDVAIKRAQLSNAHCILGSATPSLETLSNCGTKKHFGLVRLPKRVNNFAMPEMKLVDLKEDFATRTGAELISRQLAEHISRAIAEKQQVILLLNRRGYSNFVFCPSCKHILRCRNCDVSLTFHKRPARNKRQMPTITGRHIDCGNAVCHYCLAKTLVPEKCPLCGKKMAMIGLGSQRLEEELRVKFTKARIVRIDSDSMQGKSYYKVLKDFGDGRIDILAGTQMLAKGLHFPNVTVVGIISADTSLYLPDFRANERTFQLICQVAGRAGRSEKKGVVYVQTFLAGQPAIKFALAGDFDGFVKEELKHRSACNLPPYWRLAAVVMRDRNFDKLEAAGKAMRERIDYFIKRDRLEAVVRGPMPAAISRIQRFHRAQIIVQAPEAATMLRLFGSLRTAGPVRPAVTVVIDMDPVNLM